jgi:hypothetical protein
VLNRRQVLSLDDEKRALGYDHTLDRDFAGDEKLTTDSAPSTSISTPSWLNTCSKRSGGTK